MQQKHLLLLLLFILCTVSLKAQITVSGTVTENNGNTTLVGVTILEKGTTNGTVTDLDGNYSLKYLTPMVFWSFLISAIQVKK